MIDITFIYSSPSKQALKNLMESFFYTFGLPFQSADDLFYFGVFCKPETYANYDMWDEAPDGMDIPSTFLSICSTEHERIDYVKKVMNSVLKGEEEKPEWMKFVEEELSCNAYEAAPSTFLTILPKKEEYQDLADNLLQFLYSPNLLITAANA